MFYQIGESICGRDVTPESVDVYLLEMVECRSVQDSEGTYEVFVVMQNAESVKLDRRDLRKLAFASTGAWRCPEDLGVRPKCRWAGWCMCRVGVSSLVANAERALHIAAQSGRKACFWA